MAVSESSEGMVGSRGKRRREASVGAAGASDDTVDTSDDDGLRMVIDDSLHMEMARAIAVKVSSLAPKRGRQGAKSYAPSAQAADPGSEESRKLEESRSDWSELASQPRVLPVRALSTGDWIPSAQLVAMTAMRGAHFKTAGYHHHAYQTTVLRPEEALFLVEKGVLEVFEQGLPMTVQRAFHVLRPTGMTPSELTVYLMLRRMGYVLHWNSMSERRRGDDGGGSATVGGAGEGGGGPEAAAAPATAVPDRQPGSGSGFLSRLLDRVTHSVGVASSPIGGLLASLQRLQWWAPSPVPTDVDAIVGATVANDLGAVYEQLRLIAPAAAVGEVTPDALGRLRISFDVHRTDAHFKKSKLGDPDFRLCVANYTEEVPSLAEIQQLVLDAGPAALKFAVVDSGMATFYSIMDLELPIYSDWQSVEPLSSGGGGGGSGKKRRRKSGKMASPLAAASSPGGSEQ